MNRRDLSRALPSLSPSPGARAAEERALAAADDLSPLLDALGVRYVRGDGGRKLLARCPSPDHRDRSASWFLQNDPVDPRFGTHACLSCPYRGGPAHLARTADGGVASWEEAAELLASLFSGEGEAGTDPLLERAVRARLRPSGPPPGLDLPGLGMVPSPGTPGGRYLSARGLPDWAQGLLGVMWAPEGTEVRREGKAPLDVGLRAVLPVGDGEAVFSFAARAVRKDAVPKYLYPPGPRDRLLWGFALWGPSGLDVGLTEGIVDAWAVHRATGAPCYAALGNRLSAAQAARLRTARSVTVVRDPNAAGIRLGDDAAARLPSVRDVRLAGALPRGRDAGDSLRPPGDPGRLDPGELRRAWEEARDARLPGPPEVTVRYGVAARRRDLRREES